MPPDGSLPLALVRRRLTVEGIVQGVGFRPFVATTARRIGLVGFVGNDAHGVFIEVQGDAVSVEEFVERLATDAPPLARVDKVKSTRIDVATDATFRIVASDTTSARDASIAPDAATCEDCLKEVNDRLDRRYRYPFINCTNCGPRYTIVRDVPYDRERTTMASFAMCAQCHVEYEDQESRRYHAQPICCPSCGPTLALTQADGTAHGGDPIATAAGFLAAGAVVAIKGLGGYHLAADAMNESAVARLRHRKHREDRPFALMVADLAAAREICAVGDDAARLLISPQRPIVLLPRRIDIDTGIAASIAPRLHELGVMLPYTPLHHLLLAEFAGPLVMTSGNRSDEPIAFDDADALTRLSTIADAFLTHDRPIETRVDDSVARSTAAGPTLLRRSRGYAPGPIRVPWEFTNPVLGCGPEQKNTFCLGRGNQAFLSHHVGDLANFETFVSFTDGVAHLQRLLAIAPQIVAYDLHPEYLSTKYALDLTGVHLVGVQHHHAHIASCLADNGYGGPVIGVAFDGTGYGLDGTIWGGEFLVADLCTSTRVAHLAPVPLPGGAAAIREPWRMAAAYLDRGLDGSTEVASALAERHPQRWDVVQTMARNGLNSPMTSSAGRLFDAIAALLEVRDEVTYEGQAAIELEQLVLAADAGTYEVTMSDDATPQLNAVDLVRAVIVDRANAVPVEIIATKFHRAVADMIIRTVGMLRDRHGLGTVALSGGVFQNVHLLQAAVTGLRHDGFDVLTHHQVPTNDGGISLGQAVVAAARDRAGQLD